MGRSAESAFEPSAIKSSAFKSSAGRTGPGRHLLVGAIASAGFASGDRFVVGHWRSGPLGPMDDVMWATSAGERWLVAASRPVADFVSSIYHFDRVVVSPLVVEGDRRHLAVRAPDLRLELHMEAGRGWPVPAPRRRPRWLTRYVEAPIARRLLRVEAYGVSPTGVREWYQASRYRPLTAARASIDGADLGAMGPLDPPVGFGFSEPPRRPSLVEVTTVVEIRSPRRGPG